MVLFLLQMLGSIICAELLTLVGGLRLNKCEGRINKSDDSRYTISTINL